MTKISLCMIVKDEERCIERALSSIQDKVWEIIVVDTGSTDRTMEIIKEKFPKVKLFQKKFEPWSFGAARNYSISKAKGKWLFYMDADEIFVGDFPDNDNEFIYNLCIHNQTDAPGEFVKSHCARLAPNIQGMRFASAGDEEGRMHEIFQSSLKPLNIRQLDSAHIIHDGYISAVRSEKDKTGRNVGLLREQYNLKPTSQNCFYLGQELFILGEYEEVKRLANQAISLLDPANSLDVTFEPVIYNLLLSAYIETKDQEGVTEFEDKYLTKRYNPENYMSLARWYRELDNENKFIKYVWQAAKGTNSTELPVKYNESSVTYLPFQMAGDYFYKKGDNLLALYYYEMAFGTGATSPGVVTNCLHLIPKHPRNSVKWEFYARKAFEVTRNPKFLQEIGNALLNSKEAEKNKEGVNIFNSILPSDALLEIRKKLEKEGRAELAKMIRADIFHATLDKGDVPDECLSVIIPTMFKAPKEYIDYNLAMLSNHSKVKEIIIINNTGDSDLIASEGKIKVITPFANIGVNPAWNLGVKEATGDYYLLLNDDCLVSATALNDALYMIDKHQSVGIVTVNTNDIPLEDYKKLNIEKKDDKIYFVKNEFMKGQSLFGWFIMGRRSEWIDIPADFKIFFGDNFIHYQILSRGKMISRIVSNLISHKTSSTVNDLKLYEQGVLDAEGQYWNAFLQANQPKAA